MQLTEGSQCDLSAQIACLAAGGCKGKVLQTFTCLSQLSSASSRRDRFPYVNPRKRTTPMWIPLGPSCLPQTSSALMCAEGLGQACSQSATLVISTDPSRFKYLAGHQQYNVTCTEGVSCLWYWLRLYSYIAIYVYAHHSVMPYFGLVCTSHLSIYRA